MRHDAVRTTFLGTCFGLAAAVGVSRPCYAVPGWAEATKSTSHVAHECATSAAKAIKAILGSDAKIISPTDKSAYKAARVRGFSVDTAIFVYCYPNLKKRCQTGVAADYSVLVTSDMGKGVAGEYRDAFLKAFKESKSECID